MDRNNGVTASELEGSSLAAASRSTEVSLLWLRCLEAENMIEKLSTFIPEDEHYVLRMMEIRAHFEKWEGPSEVAFSLQQFPYSRLKPAAAVEQPCCEDVNPTPPRTR